MRRIIHSVSFFIFVQLTMDTAHLSAAANDANGNNAGSGLISAIIGVIVPALLVIGIGGGIYAWLRRNKTSFSRFLSQRKNPQNWSASQSMSIPSSPSPVPSRRPSRARRPQRAVEQTTRPEPEANTLEAISLNDLEQVLSLREGGRIQEYYESIAMIIKRYVGEKYQIKILDATTGQILSALPDNLTDTVVDHVGEILRMCDMIHFSRHRPSRSELDRIYQTAKEFVENHITVTAVEAADAEEEAEDNDEIYGRYEQ